MIGQTLNHRFKITAQIGTGAMGEVYRATDQQTNQEVAVKVMARHLTFDPDMLERFRREGEALRQLRHPNIVGFIDTFQHERQQIICLEYVPGGSLYQLIKQGPLPLDRARRIALELCDALTRAHHLNIIHRDLKPENVLIAQDSAPRLADFGVARLVSEGTRLTGTGTQVGTPYYMSPEAWQGQHLDAQTDIWSLGVVLYEMLGGQVPFGGDTLVAVMNKVLTAPLPDLKALRPDVPDGLVKIIRKMLVRDKAKRYQTMREVALDLERVTNGNGRGKEKSQTRVKQEIAARDRGRLIIALGAGLLVIAGLAAVGGIGLWLLNSPSSSGRATQAALMAELRATQTALAVALAPTPTAQPANRPVVTQTFIPTATAQQTVRVVTNTFEPSATPSPAPPSATPGLPGEALANAWAGNFRGTTVTVLGSFGGVDIVHFRNNSIRDFEDQTGIDIRYEELTDFDTALAGRINGGSPPDIVDFPQPGLLGTFAKAGKVVDLNKSVNAAWLKQNYIQSWLDMATMQSPDGPIMAGVWSRVGTKSLVWYPKAEFDRAGYEVPQTWDELMALTDRIAQSGSTPWCLGMESGVATGWIMTDWIEDVLLRTTSPQNYDRWVRGELKFNSPEVRKALDIVTRIWFTDRYAYGGRQAITTTFFGDAPKPMFEKPPKCWLHKQGSFIINFFPEGLQAGVDYDFFYLPPIDPQYGRPALGVGDLYAALNDQAPVRAVIQYLSTGDSVKGWVEAGGVISPHKDASLLWYKDPVSRKVAEIIQNATVVRFDGSDLMPSAVGATAFWSEMTAFVNGTTSTTLLDEQRLPLSYD